MGIEPAALAHPPTAHSHFSFSKLRESPVRLGRAQLVCEENRVKLEFYLSKHSKSKIGPKEVTDRAPLIYSGLTQMLFARCVCYT